MSDVTRILSAIEQGDPHAAEQLLPLVYDELRKLAAQKLAQEKPGQTLQATALVHEAYLRLVDADQAQHWNSRGHFFAAAAEAMRRILVEHARRKKRAQARRRPAARRPRSPTCRLAPTPPTTCSPSTRPSTGSPQHDPVKAAAGQAPLLRRPDRRGGGRRRSASPGPPPTGYWAYARAWLHRSSTGGSRRRPI